MKELCPKCFNSTSDKKYTTKQLEKQLLSKAPLKQSPLCSDCKTFKLNLLTPQHLIVDLKTFKRIKKDTK